MSQTKTHLVTTIKLLVILGLLAYVFSTIQWQDTLLVQEPAGEITYLGKISGRWNAYPVDFIKHDGETVTINPGAQTETHQLNPGFFTYLGQADPVWLALGCLAFVMVVMFGALRWHWLVNTQNLTLSLGQAIRLTWIGIFFNNFVPGQTGGDLVKAYYIARNSPQNRLTAVLTVIADRLLGLSALIVVSLVTVSVFFERFKELALILWAGLALGLIALVILLNRPVRRVLGLSALVRKLPEKITGIIHQLDAAITQYHDHKSGIAIWWGLSVANHIVNILGIYALSRAIDMGVPAIEFFALVPVIFIVSAIPIAPNGWGIGEALFGNLFGQYGAAYLPGSSNAVQVMSTRGVALSVLFRIMSTCLSLIGGLLLLISRDKIPTQPTTIEQQEPK